MTQTDIFKDRGAERFLRAVAAVAVLSALIMAVGIAASGDTDAEVNTLNTSPEDPKVVYGIHGFDNKYMIDIASGSAVIFPGVYQNPSLLVIKMLEFEEPGADGKFHIQLTVNTKNLDNPPEQIDFALKFEDEGIQDAIMYLRLVLINPVFEIEASTEYDVIAGNGSWIDLNMKGMPVLSQMPVGSTAVYKLDCGGGYEAAEVRDGLVKLPTGLEAGTKTCRMQVALTIPGTYSQTFTSEEFKVNVQAKPTFTLPASSYDKFAGESLTVSLDLTGTDVPGKWVVTKPNGAGNAEIDYTAAAVEFGLDGLTSDHEGYYSVKFVASGGAESATQKFLLNVYTVVDSGVIKVTGLGADGLLQVGNTSLKSKTVVEEVVLCSLTVTDADGGAVKDQFDFDSDGHVLVKSKIPEGKYTLRFTTDSGHRITDLVVDLKYIEPPKVIGITPVSSFTVG